METNQEPRKPRTWQLWERPEHPQAFQLQKRDLDIIREVFRHRFLRPAHIHTLFGGSPENLARRCRLLWQHGYLERPRALRPTRVLTEELVYGLGKTGARLLEHLDPRLRIGHLDWTETPKKQVGLPYIDHQLGIATFFVCLKAACDRRGVDLLWDGHCNQQRFDIRAPGEKKVVIPDSYFMLRIPGRGVAHHFLEVDRGNISLGRMHARYRRYFLWWKTGMEKRPFRHFRVLTITRDPDYVDSLRRVACETQHDTHNHPHSLGAWKALLFSHFAAFHLDHPDRILEPVFHYADEETPISLIG